MRGIKCEFDQSEYEFENGRAPKGYGSWGFAYEGYEFWAHGTLREAEQACVDQVRKDAPKGYSGVVEVKILP